MFIILRIFGRHKERKDLSKKTFIHNTNSNSQTIPDTVKLKIKPIKKEIKKKQIDTKPISIDNNNFLSYDNNIKSEYQKDISSSKTKINYDIISKLPSLKLKNIIIEEDDNDDNYNENNSENINNQDNEDEVDTDNLEMDEIADKKYYFDYNKGIIYSLALKPIGFIDEYGELNFEE